MADFANSTLAPFSHQGPVTRAIRSMQTAPEPPRRGFLRGLLTLPMIGGGVHLIGAPTAAAEPITEGLLNTYATWLWGERIRVFDELYPDKPPGLRGVEISNPGYWYHQQKPDQSFPPASTRAALVLSAVGCDWRR